MTARQIMDFRLWAPWSERALGTFEKTAGSAWANPQHPASEGRRSAVWLEAMQATVSGFFGGGHVAFFPHRESAIAHLLGAHRDAMTSATNRKPLLQRLTTVDVDQHGLAQWPDCDAVLLQYGNEETGVIDRYAGRAVRIVDATNALGRTPIDAAWDYLVGSARAWGAPVDIAVVVAAQPLGLHPVPSLPEIAVAVTELEHTWAGVESRSRLTSEAMAAFEQQVGSLIPDVWFHGAQQVPHMRSLSVLHVDAETLMRELDAAGYAVGAGSACSVDLAPSHVLQAMGVQTDGNLRIALPIDFDLETLPRFADALADTVSRLRRNVGIR